MFEENSSQYFKTCVGASLSIIIIISATILGIIIGIELFQKKLPIVYSTEDLVDNMEIPLNDFPIIISFTDFLGHPINKIDSLFQIKVKDKLVNEKGLEPVENAISYLKKCVPENFPNHVDFINKAINTSSIDGKNIYCINAGNNLILKKRYMEKNSASLLFLLYDCGASTEIFGVLKDNATNPYQQCDPNRSKYTVYQFKLFKYIY